MFRKTKFCIFLKNIFMIFADFCFHITTTFFNIFVFSISEKLSQRCKFENTEYFYFLYKKQKRCFRNWIWHKIQKIRGKFSWKSSQFVSYMVRNQCERFFHFFIFRKVIDNEMGFGKTLPTNTRKKCVKLTKIIKIQAIWTCLERLIQARINLMVF